MKFAKELEADLVPEWKLKYLDYKAGKKKIKAITRAIQNAHKSPKSLRTPTLPRIQRQPRNTPSVSGKSAHGSTTSPRPRDPPSIKIRSPDRVATGPVTVPNAKSRELEPLTRPYGAANTLTHERKVYTTYGSIIGSPPSQAGAGPAPSITLPDPALDLSAVPESIDTKPHSRPSIHGRANTAPTTSGSESAYHVGKTKHPPGRHMRLAGRHMRLIRPKKAKSPPTTQADSPLMKSIFSKPNKKLVSTSPHMADVPLEALEDIDTKQDEFWDFLDKEYDKIESFYKLKEDEATERLRLLREQLHVMRDHRLEEIMAANYEQERRESTKLGLHLGHPHDTKNADDTGVKEGTSVSQGHASETHHGLDVLYHPIDAVKRAGGLGHTKMTFNIMGTPPSDPIQHLIDKNRDYVRNPHNHDVPYSTAKRKLKLALQELYRALELLKSYAILNRTAFRKINKKYDKAVHARPTMRYMNEKVNNAWFVQSDVVDGHIVAIEDLYARYFEKGNHKLAVGKLRKRKFQGGEYTGSVFRIGVLVATGLVFGLEGLVYGGNLLFDTDHDLVEKTSYLLQLYGGYFIMLLLFSFFCIDCLIFDSNKINYVFVFEFDRSNLDWRQLSEFPAIFTFFLGFLMWMNFSRVGGDAMYIYYPVILIVATGLVLLMPAKTMYYRAREWFLYSVWRLIPAGFYSVHFRDFFLGDMFCSLTYSLGNIELFFCLYANNWNDPSQCNSNHSRLLGFFTALPGIWRALQCIRRYRDTRNIFPHLVNCGKYSFTILFSMTLSMYRINRDPSMKALFITFACINGLYTSIWDLFMDFSLMDPSAKYPFLRQTLALHQKWVYYFAMIIDPILRHNWILYAIFVDDLQHSSLVSFFIAFSEVVRRGIWTILRVENEHCTNVGRFRAYRDLPLPYQTESPDESKPSPEQPHIASPPGPTPSTGRPARTSGADIERPETQESVRHRRRTHSSANRTSPSMAVRVGHIIRTAHAQDFERKKLPGDIGPDDDDDDDDDDSDRQNEEADDESSDEEEGNTSGLRDQEDEQDLMTTRNLLALARSRSKTHSSGRHH